MFARNRVGLLAAIVVVLLATIGSSMVAASLHIGPWKPTAVIPHRTSVPPAASATVNKSTTAPSTKVSSSQPAKASPQGSKAVSRPVAPSAPLEVSIAGVLDVSVGGSITLAKSPNCRTEAPCLFPPEDNGDYRKAWWYDYGTGSKPSNPSSDTTYLLGHSYRFESDAAFNNLPTVRVGDIIVEKTHTGVLRYRVYRSMDIPFAELDDPHYGVFRVMPGTLVMITCGLRDKGPDEENPPPADKNHVIWAKLVQ